MPAAVRVLVVDDSAVLRQTLRRELSKDPGIEVVGVAPDPYVARDMIVSLKPDVVSLDVEMPRMDGITFLRKLMHYYPIPVVIVSSLTPRGSDLAVEALAEGAVAVCPKPRAAFSAVGVVAELKDILKSAAWVDVRKRQGEQAGKPVREVNRSSLTKTTNAVLAIGASTGGTRAIQTLLEGLPVNLPGTVITQHMPATFTASFAKRLADESGLDVTEATTGEPIIPGKVYVAPGNTHLLVRRQGGSYYTDVRTGPLVQRQRPSVDVLFRSVARSVGRNAFGVILTGMGCDGAKGLLEMREAGAHTIAQDEESSVVFGMPRAAIELGGADEIVGLDHIAKRLIRLFEER
jgi:two-component system chemotaxis response regulator CheB